MTNGDWRLEVLNTGTELLLGHVANSHAGYFGRELFPLGLRIQRQETVPDGAAIRTALLEAFPRCDILLVTGGLGPTTDDITREITAELLGLRLELSELVREMIAARLARRAIPFRERMLRQAMVPAGAKVLPNRFGTAPGLYIEPIVTPASASPHLFLLPGPPRELTPMFETEVLPVLRALCGSPPDRGCRVYHFVGIGESAIEELIGARLEARGDIEVGYCARPNQVDMRLIAPASVLDSIEPELFAAAGRKLVSQRGEAIEQVVVNRLCALGLTLAVAESCTGGLLAHRITNVPGASAIFLEGLVTYSNDAKSRTLGVPEELLAREGAVCEPVARAMAEGAAARSGAHFGIGVTGIAGPGGGSPEKPVGTVFIALATRGGETICRHESYPTDRETFKQLAAQAALDLLRLAIF